MQGPVGVQIDRQHHGDHEVVVARLTGELDISVADTTGEQIAQAVPSSARGLVVDMSGLDFLDSSGVSMLFGLVRRIGNRRQELRVVAPEGRPVARVLDIVEFDRAAPIHGQLAAAVDEIVTPRGRRSPPG
jgi:anti-sigma B factor antagonist